MKRKLKIIPERKQNFKVVTDDFQLIQNEFQKRALTGVSNFWKTEFVCFEAAAVSIFRGVSEECMVIFS